MSLLKRVINRLKRDYFHSAFQRASRRVLQTPPLKPGNMPYTLLSMVHTRDVLSYLVSVKSFARHANPTRIVVVCDPTINDADRTTLKAHVPHIELRAADEFTHPDIPRGGCWERLYAISEYNPDSYVVQLDADTVTTRPIPEIIAAIENGHGFVLGEVTGQTLLTLQACSDRATPLLKEDAHIQTRTEAIMSQVGLPKDALYVRGCAGFTGFPAHIDMRKNLLDFSAKMTAAQGALWKSWGTEQVTSNYLVANAPGTRVLPFPKYGTPDQATDDTAFLHFIGSLRFINGRYEKCATRAILEMS